MSNQNYFHGGESEQFSFFRIPRALMTDERFHTLSTDAKLLYGLMLDRMCLSRQKGWLDEQNRVYIYFTLDEIQETLACGHNKATRLLVELEKHALIERIKQGQGKPAKIYVKNFVEVKDDKPETPPEEHQPVKVKIFENPTSTLPLLKPLDCPKGECSYTNKNYTEFSYINLSINPKEQPPTSRPLGAAPPCQQHTAQCLQLPLILQQAAPLPHSDAAGVAVRASMSFGSTNDPCWWQSPQTPEVNCVPP